MGNLPWVVVSSGQLRRFTSKQFGGATRGCPEHSGHEVVENVAVFGTFRIFSGE